LTESSAASVASK